MQGISATFAVGCHALAHDPDGEHIAQGFDLLVAPDAGAGRRQPLVRIHLLFLPHRPRYCFTTCACQSPSSVLRCLFIDVFVLFLAPPSERPKKAHGFPCAYRRRWTKRELLKGQQPWKRTFALKPANYIKYVNYCTPRVLSCPFAGFAPLLCRKQLFPQPQRLRGDLQKLVGPYELQHLLEA